MAKSGKGGGLFLALFSLPFAGVGVIMGGIIIWTLVVYFQQKSWIQVPAKITHTELVKHRSSKSTTYKVEANYDYEYNGKLYRGASKVSQYSGSDNISGFHRNLHAELKKCRDSETPYHCFVNPEKPDDAVLFRGLRPVLIALLGLLAVVFGGVGFGLMAFGIKTIIAESKLKKNMSTFPGQPWLFRPEWHSGIINSSSKLKMIFAILFALFWNLLSAPVVFAVLTEDSVRKNKLMYLILLFPLVGLGLIIWAVICITRMVKFGTSQFKMDSVPGVIGGKLSGRICTTVNIAPEKGFELSLKCIKQVVTGSGKNRSTQEYVVWEQDHVVKRELLYQDLTRSEIPVLFAIPYDDVIESSIESGGAETIIWRLQVKAEVPGLDYDASFEVPVFRTDDSSADFVLDEEIPELAESVSTADIISRGNIIVSPAYSSGGSRFTFPMARNIGSGIVMTVVTGIWTAVTVVLFNVKVPLVFPIIISVIDVFLIWGWLYTWFDYRVIEIDKYCMNLSGGLFGIGSTKTIDIKNFDTFIAKMSSQTNNTTYYQVMALSKDGKKYKVASGLKGKKLADSLIEEMNKAMGK